MKCLQRYTWVKLPRNFLPTGKGLLGTWMRLASRAAFRKEHWDIPPMAEHWHFPNICRAVVPYAIASNCEEVRLFLNGKRFYVPKPEDCPNQLITGFLPYQPGQVEVRSPHGPLNRWSSPWPRWMWRA